MNYKTGDIVSLLSNVDEVRTEKGWSQPLLEYLPSYYLEVAFIVIEVASDNVRLDTNHPTFNKELISVPDFRYNKRGISAFLIPITAVKLCDSKSKTLFKLLSNYLLYNSN